MHRFLVVSALLALGCAGANDPPASTVVGASVAAARPDPVAPPPPPPQPEVMVTAPACGYGGSAPGASVFLDVQSAYALHHVTVSLAMSDLADLPMAISRAPEQLVVSPVERGTLDFSTQGTTPFDGTIAASAPTRLQYFAGLRDDPAAASRPRLGGSLRLHVTVHADEGTFVTTCDTAHMWPSS